MSDIDRIGAGRDGIRAEIAKWRDAIAAHQQKIEQLAAKLGELDIAERVLRQMAGIGPGDPAVEAIIAAATPTRSGRWPGVTPKKARAVKPAGLPSYPEMIREAINFAKGQGFIGLESIEIVT